MPVNLFARGGAASGKNSGEARSPNRTRSGTVHLEIRSAPWLDWSALTGLESALRLIDHIDAAFAPHDAIVAMAAAQGFKRIADFHGTDS
jgi:hypothetical protein